MSIDLVSTRAGTDAETAGCARLLAYVITQAIRDAATPSRPDVFDWDKEKAGRWLFQRSPAFVLYARLIGLDAEALLEALADPTRGSPSTAGQITGEQRRELQVMAMRYKFLPSPVVIPAAAQPEQVAA